MKRLLNSLTVLTLATVCAISQAQTLGSLTLNGTTVDFSSAFNTTPNGIVTLDQTAFNNLVNSAGLSGFNPTLTYNGDLDPFQIISGSLTNITVPSLPGNIVITATVPTVFVVPAGGAYTWSSGVTLSTLLAGSATVTNNTLPNIVTIQLHQVGGSWFTIGTNGTSYTVPSGTQTFSTGGGGIAGVAVDGIRTTIDFNLTQNSGVGFSGAVEIVPEPGSIALLIGAGMTGSVFALRRNRRRTH